MHLQVAHLLVENAYFGPLIHKFKQSLRSVDNLHLFSSPFIFRHGKGDEQGLQRHSRNRREVPEDCGDDSQPGDDLFESLLYSFRISIVLLNYNLYIAATIFQICSRLKRAKFTNETRVFIVVNV